MELAIATQTLQNKESKRLFLQSNIFHERHMNSCPIGCEGCAVSAKTSVKGAIRYQDLLDFYKEAQSYGVSLQITKVEGYDPAFVQYADDKEIPFAQSIVDAVDHGHQIITPICTTGSWNSPRTKWQIAELGKLSSKYRYYQYPSGNSGSAYALSVPREINPFRLKYDVIEHIDKILADASSLSERGDVDVLVYFNSKVDGDKEIAERIVAELSSQLSEPHKSRSNLIVTDFNSETLPESCYRYKNSVLFSDKGFDLIDPVKLEWDQ